MMGLLADWVRFAPNYSMSKTELIIQLLHKEAELLDSIPYRFQTRMPLEELAERLCKVTDPSLKELDLSMICRFLDGEALILLPPIAERERSARYRRESIFQFYNPIYHLRRCGLISGKDETRRQS